MTEETSRGARREAWPASVSRPLVSPLQTSVVYTAESPDALDAQYEGRAEGWTYSREGHPNAAVLASAIGRMEGASRGVVTGSGMSAVTAALLAVLRAGDHVVGADQLYGRCLRLMNEDLPRLGIATTLADPTDRAKVEAALRPETRMILIETVSNPTLRIADLEGIAALAKARGIVLAVDNTFTTPRALRPLDLGADLVIHSVTKLLSGHSDAMLGFVGTRNAEMGERVEVLATTMGLVASPFDCWMAERGMLTFDLRHERASETAARLAEALGATDGVRRVVYPERRDHPDHARAKALLGDSFGNMVSFEIEGGRSAANAFVEAARPLAFAPTLGDVTTTISHPPTSSHRALSPGEREALGITEGFFRVSVGCEEPSALIAQITSAVREASR